MCLFLTNHSFFANSKNQSNVEHVKITNIQCLGHHMNVYLNLHQKSTLIPTFKRGVYGPFVKDSKDVKFPLTSFVPTLV